MTPIKASRNASEFGATAPMGETVVPISSLIFIELALTHNVSPFISVCIFMLSFPSAVFTQFVFIPWRF